MQLLEGYQGQFGVIEGYQRQFGALGIWPFGKEEETGIPYTSVGTMPIKRRTRVPPDAMITWTTPEDMETITITIVDGADHVLSRIQVYAVNQLKRTLPGAPVNRQYWDKRFKGWKGESKGKWFTAKPELVDFYYYVDGNPKEAPVIEQQTTYSSNQAQEAGRLAQDAASQGNLDLAAKYMEMAIQFAKQTEDTSQKAQSSAATEAAEIAKAAALQAQAAVEQLASMIKGQAETKMPSWIWIAVAAGVFFLFMRK